MKPRRDALVFAALCIFFAGVTLLWLRLNHAPPTWDDAWYLTNSLVMYDAWTARGSAGFGRQFLAALEYKAPLIAALPAPFYLALGRNWHFGYLVNIAAMPVLFGTVWAIGKRRWSSRVGLIAVYIVGTMPLLCGLARWYLVEYVLAAVVALALWLLMLSRDLESGPATAALGVLCGVGLLLKADFPLYVLAPFLFALWRSKRRLRAAALLAIPCLILALQWYALHWRATLVHALAGGYGDPAIIQGTGAILSAGAITRYLTNVVHHGISTYYAAIAVAMAVLLALQKRVGTLRSLTPLGLWGVAFLVFLFGGNKDVRFIAPILPAFALGTASLLDAVARRRTWLLVVALAFPLSSMLAVSFSWPYRAPDLPYAHPYGSRNWRQQEILSAIQSRVLVRPGQKKRVIVGTDRPFFNVHNFELFAVHENLPLAFETTAYQNDLDVILPALDSASFVVLKDGGQPESAFFNPHSAEVLQYLRTSTGFEEIPFAHSLPDGGLARIFQRNPSQASALVLPAFHADFGGMMELTGLAVNRTAGVVEVKRRWRALSRMDRDYWSFTHIVDAQNRIVAQLDRRIQNGDAPTTDWAAAEEAYEDIRVALPASAPRENLRLRFGVYHPATGERLSVKGQVEGKAQPADGAAALSFAL